MSGPLTTWFRIEPLATSNPPGPDHGLRARVYDPAWMLGRQWQLGELRGEDAASPAWTRVRAKATSLNRLRRGDPDAGSAAGAASIATLPLSPGQPVEPLIEGEHLDTERFGTAVAAGAHLLAALDLAGFADVGLSLRAAFPLSDPDPERHDPQARLRWRVFARVGMDGLAMLAALRDAGPGALPAQVAVDPVRADELVHILSCWHGWYDNKIAVSTAVSSAWVASRLEHHFAIGADDPRGGTELVFHAPAFDGDRLDWDDLRLDMSPAQPSAVDAESPAVLVHQGLASRVTFPGMPVNRWWEIEDPTTSYGHVEAERGDLARLLLVEFMSVYGNDWFLAPLDVGYGTVVAVQSVVVVDTFGETSLLHAAHPSGWSMFNVTGTDPGLLVLPEVAVSTLKSEPIEQVRFARDEAANLAWGIERTVSGPADNRVDRHERWRERLASMEVPERDLQGLGPDVLTYQVAIEPPDHWIPLIPVASGRRSIRLRRGSVQRGDGLTFEAEGTLLEPGRPFVLHEEELPRGGVTVERSWQLVRGADGTTHTWIARRVKPGRGDVSSAVVYDAVRATTPT